MTPITLLLQALVAGALAQQGQPHSTVKRAYQALRTYLQQHYPTDSLALLEKRPDSPARLEALREELEGTSAAQDNKLLELAYALMTALLAHPVPNTNQAVAVDLEEVQAALIQLRQIRSSGTAVKMKRVRAEKIVADDLSAGEGGAAFRAEFKDSSVKQMAVNIITGKVDEAALLRRYLQWLLNSFDRLKLDGIDPEVAKNEGANRLRLSTVYTALLTKATEWQEGTVRGSEAQMLRAVKEQDRRLSALEQLNRQRHLVLLGDPGSGKSTFVDFVALCLAGEALKDEKVNLKLLTTPLPPDDEATEKDESKKPKPQPWKLGTLLPVRVILRDLVAWEGFPAPGKAGSAAVLWGFVEAELQRLKLGECCTSLEAQLKDKGGLILLDGLDEVPDANQRRTQIVQVINDFAAAFGKCRVLVTSRPYAYSDRAWQLQDFAVTMLEDFSQGQIRHFIDHWYAQRAELLGDDLATAQHRAQQLKETIFGNPRLYALAERPLLLTLTAGIHAWKQGSLPEGRAELYEQAVQLLLVGWEERIANSPNSEIASQSLSKLLGLERSDLRPVLQRIAFAAHRDQQGLTGSADIEIGSLLVAFNKLLRDKQKHELSESRLIRYLEQRSGLLISRAADHYALPHRTFQEYLAACYLLRDDFPDKLSQLARQDTERWREVTLLAAARAADIPSTIWDLGEMLSKTAAAQEPPLAQVWGMLLAGQAVEEGMKAEDRLRRPEKLATIQRNLITVLEGAALPAAERALAGRTLAKLGDPRPYTNSLEGMEFCFVPKGDFYRTEDNQRAQLGYDFWIGRFPVTQAQFAQFTAAGGYQVERNWAEAIEAGHWKEGAVINWVTNKYQSSPPFFGTPFDLPNHPVVGITWYEAMAFCRWLNEHPTLALPEAGRGLSREAFKFGEEWEVRLPTEAEWEKTARGGVEIPEKAAIRRLGDIRERLDSARRSPQSNDWEIGDYRLQTNSLPQRSYPWGEEPPTERANYKASKIDSPSAIGCFRAGASPYGVEELCGTVWEWNNDDHEKGRKVLRGRAYYSDEILTSARSVSPPDHWHYGWGFRCVFVPISR